MNCIQCNTKEVAKGNSFFCSTSCCDAYNLKQDTLTADTPKRATDTSTKQLGTCKACKFWQCPKERDECEKLHGTCDKVDSDFNNESMIVVLNEEGYSPWLYTREDFGCLLFERKQ